MTRAVFKIVLIAWATALLAAGVSSQTAKTQEYAVYAHVLKEIYRYNRKTYSGSSHFVIVDRSQLDPETFGAPTRKYRTLAKKFKRVNNTPVSIERKFPICEYSKTYFLIPQKEIDELLRLGRIGAEKQREEEKLSGRQVIDVCGSRIWMRFYDRFPEANGYHTLSRVGFYGNLAMVEVKYESGCGGFNRTYVLERTKRRWITVLVAGGEWVALSVDKY